MWEQRALSVNNSLVRGRHPACGDVHCGNPSSFFVVVVFYLGLILLHGKAFLFSLDSVDQKDLCDQICGIAT